jgi:hypothetical protein
MIDELAVCKETIRLYEAEIKRLVECIDDHRKCNNSPNEDDQFLYDAIDPRCW